MAGELAGSGSGISPGRPLRRKLRLTAYALLGLVVVAAPWWGPRLMSEMTFFRMQRVEVHGLRYLAESELLDLLAVDTTMSIWSDLAPFAERVTAHPQIDEATLSRRLPGTLVVRISERKPVALVPRAQGFVAIDDSGRPMSVDPSRDNVDVPILQSADTLLVRFLVALRDSQPAIFSRVSTVRRAAKDEMRIETYTYPVLAMSNITIDRLLDILPVERDLVARGVRVAELDLRYHGQVIVRPK
jgi:cell division protein FtsQ